MQVENCISTLTLGFYSVKDPCDLLKNITNKQLNCLTFGQLLNSANLRLFQAHNNPHKNFIFFRILGTYVRLFYYLCML